MRVVAIALLGLGLACGGLGSPTAELPVPVPEPVTVTPKKLTFGRPTGWTQEKETFEEDGHKTVLYTLDSDLATVQIILHSPGSPPPSAAGNHLDFVSAMRAEGGDALTFPEPQDRTRDLAGEQVSGTVQAWSATTDGGVIHGEHQVWPLAGATTNALVVIDLGDPSDAASLQAVEEVLRTLSVP